jgi:hypothetical protein
MRKNSLSLKNLIILTGHHQNVIVINKSLQKLFGNQFLVLVIILEKYLSIKLTIMDSIFQHQKENKIKLKSNKRI